MGTETGIDLGPGLSISVQFLVRFCRFLCSFSGAKSANQFRRKPICG